MQAIRNAITGDYDHVGATNADEVNGTDKQNVVLDEVTENERQQERDKSEQEVEDEKQAEREHLQPPTSFKKESASQQQVENPEARL